MLTALLKDDQLNDFEMKSIFWGLFFCYSIDGGYFTTSLYILSVQLQKKKPVKTVLHWKIFDLSQWLLLTTVNSLPDCALIPYCNPYTHSRIFSNILKHGRFPRHNRGQLPSRGEDDWRVKHLYLPILYIYTSIVLYIIWEHRTSVVVRMSHYYNILYTKIYFIVSSPIVCIAAATTTTTYCRNTTQ